MLALGPSSLDHLIIRIKTNFEISAFPARGEPFHFHETGAKIAFAIGIRRVRSVAPRDGVIFGTISRNLPSQSPLSDAETDG